MSALPPKADIRTQRQHVRFGPKADSCTNCDACSIVRAENTLGFSHTPFRFSRSRERLDHARQGPGDLVNYERNS